MRLLKLKRGVHLPIHSFEGATMQSIKLALAGIVAVLAMALSVQSAAAYDMTFTPGDVFSASTGAGTLRLSDGNGIINFSCPMTLEGALDTGPVPITAGSQFGTIDAVTVGSCAGGTIVTLTGVFGWALKTDTALGALPNGATGLQFTIEGFSWEITTRILGITVRCLYSGNLGAVAPLTGSNPYTTVSFTTLGSTIPKAAGAGACPASTRASGTFTLDAAQSLAVS